MDVGYNGLVVGAYNQYSSLISSVTVDATGRDHTGRNMNPDGQDLIELAFADIYSISFFQQYTPADGLGPEGYLLDDMSFTPTTSTSPIPEPATLLLLGTGFLSMAGVGIRRKLRQ